jgi:hypothetical protein
MVINQFCVMLCYKCAKQSSSEMAWYTQLRMKPTKPTNPLGEFSPKTDEGKFFVCWFIIYGLAVVVTALGTVTTITSIYQQKV